VGTLEEIRSEPTVWDGDKLFKGSRALSILFWYEVPSPPCGMETALAQGFSCNSPMYRSEPTVWDGDSISSKGNPVVPSPPCGIVWDYNAPVKS
jgi:hypothetical protein